MLYRVKQFFLAIKSKVNDEDLGFVNKYLNKEQIALFRKLKEYEQKHCINVAMDIQSLYSEIKNIENKDDLIIAALLHDIGKVECKLNLVDKSALVMLDKISKGKMKKYDNIKKVDAYYNHPQRGYRLLKNIGESEKILYLVKNHHNEKLIDNKELNILKKYDDEN